jgi:hypothetical protein
VTGNSRKMEKINNDDLDNCTVHDSGLAAHVGEF